jgi:hypothetical protein
MTATPSLRLFNFGRPCVELIALSALTIVMALFAGMPSTGMYEWMTARGIVDSYPNFTLAWVMNGAFWAFTFMPVLSTQVDKDKPYRPWLAWHPWAKAHSLILASCYYGALLESTKRGLNLYVDLFN